MFRTAPLNAYRRLDGAPASAVPQPVVVRNRALLFHGRSPEDDRRDNERQDVKHDPDNRIRHAYKYTSRATLVKRVCC